MEYYFGEIIYTYVYMSIFFQVNPYLSINFIEELHLIQQVIYVMIFVNKWADLQRRKL